MSTCRHFALAVGAALATTTAAGAQHNELSVGPRAGGAVQAVRAVRLLPGIQLGGVLPMGGLADFYNTGVRVGGTLTAVVPTRPYGARLSLTYDRLSGGTVVPPGELPLDVEAGSMVSLALSALVSERAERTALLYFVAGVGVHRLDAPGSEISDDEPTDDPDVIAESGGTETRFGASVGGGITFRLGPLPSYLEVQVVKLFGADAMLVPVVVGIQLGR